MSKKFVSMTIYPKMIKESSAMLRQDRANKLSTMFTHIVNQDGMCPVASGELRKSYKVESSPEGIRHSYNTPYALKVHEDPTFRHRSGKHKWTEISLNKAFRILQDQGYFNK